MKKACFKQAFFVHHLEIYKITSSMNIKSTVYNRDPRFRGDSNICTPVGSRTPNLLIRSQMLYPIELQVHEKQKSKYES